ncbi:pyridoxamine 5'-phosphate oxidase [Bacteroidetes bacterium endosymbiont of Geopemphigus sp.]|uniref:pyridoxamine 5'-phosphate oxidase n=1 Tax=Bacteroidetes bacterium endosymbiont of Geopemphigus sp. TaxID=2047937 RepID=UPI000CD1104B|nr:pyridoxamine 5'-phosphate oxidase [Bacteroidetes bacterium endosymbiont of Geopemphigus sp.]
MNRDFSHLRKNYIQKKLLEKDLPRDPMLLFDSWFQEALNSEYLLEPNAVSLSTVDEDHSPGARVVLLKSFSDEGFVFYTNYKSKKAYAIERNSKVCLSFFWPDTERQIIIKGQAKKLRAEDSDIYFLKRPRESSIGAWASQQSSIIPSRIYLEERYVYYENRFRNHNFHRPPFWGGYVVKPHHIEFWQGRNSRLHDRICFTLIEKQQWKIERLAP